MSQYARYSSDTILNKLSAVTHTQPSVTSSSGVVLASNGSRKYALIVNHSAVMVYLSLGAAAAVDSGIPLQPDGEYTINGLNLWTGAIYAIVSTGTIDINVTEAT